MGLSTLQRNAADFPGTFPLYFPYRNLSGINPEEFNAGGRILMRAIPTIALAFFVTTCGPTLAHAADVSFHRSLNVQGNVTLNVCTSSGDIHVFGVDGNTIQIFGKVHSASTWHSFGGFSSLGEIKKIADNPRSSRAAALSTSEITKLAAVACFTASPSTTKFRSPKMRPSPSPPDRAISMSKISAVFYTRKPAAGTFARTARETAPRLRPALAASSCMTPTAP